VRGVGAERGVHELGAAEDGGGDGDVATVDRDGADVGEHRAIEGDRQAGDHVAPVVGRAEHDQVGRVATGDGAGEGRRDRHTLEVALRVDRVELRDAVLTELGGHGIGVVAAVERLDGAAQLAGLGDQLEGDRRHLVAGGLGVDPDLVEAHQMTFCFSRNSTIFLKPSPSSSTTSPA
jgi:hypothetical protein